VEQLSKAMLVAMWHDEIEFIDVQYNPAELTFSKAVQVAEVAIPGLDAPLVQYVRGQAETLTVDLFFDTTEEGTGPNARSVTEHTDRIYQLLKIEPATHAPPVCAFQWNTKFPGSDVSEKIGNQRRNDFQCVIESIRQRFTMFSPEGVPLRAVLTVTMREYRTLDEQLAQPPRESADRTTSHVVRRGDTLGAIAARHYRRGDAWRDIAAANGIEDPRRLEPGVFLHLPPND
jgi:hypothetical protein